MERSIEHVWSTSNFDSTYNAPLLVAPQKPACIRLTSWGTFCTLSDRPSSPLFRRAISPPPRRLILPKPGPKFNFDLYKMDESISDYVGYPSPSYRALSPTSTTIIHHRSLYSPPPSPSWQTQSCSKLRAINDELCQTLARAELNGSSSASPHYHIYHYPISQLPQQTHRPRSACPEYSPSTHCEVSPNLHKAHVTYRVHFPEQHRSPSRKTSRHRSRSSSSSDSPPSEEPVIIDLYPTKDQGFVRQTRRQAESQSPWVVEGTSVRRGSYSAASTPRSPKTANGLHYGDKPIKSHRRSVRDKERPSSSSRNRTPHTSSRTHERVWHPPSRTTSDRSPKYFQPIVKPEHDMSTRVRTVIDETESEPATHRTTMSHRPDIRISDPKLKRRIAHAESKVKSAWQPTATRLSPSTVRQAKPPTPQPIKQTTIVTPSKAHDKSARSEPRTPVKKAVPVPPQPSTTTNTGRGSENDVPAKPFHESTPRDQSVVEKDDELVNDLFGNESHISEKSDRKDVPHASPPPRKPSTELPKSPVPESEKEANSTLKDNVSVMEESDGDTTRDQEPSPPAASSVSNTAKPHATQPTPPPPEIPHSDETIPPPQSDQKKDESVAKDHNKDHDDDENDREVARSFDIDSWLNGASKLIVDASKPGAVPPPQPPPPPQAPKVKSPPRRKVQPPSPAPATSDENLYKPPFGPKPADPKPAAASPPPAGETDDVNDFFS